MTLNPFPGPQPYKKQDEVLFCGRRDAAAQFVGTMLVQRSVTFYGPSGSGKSSLMAAAILPEVERDRQGYLIVVVDQWPEDRSPLATLLTALQRSLDEVQAGEDEDPARAILALLASTGRRPVFFYLDQVEQILLRHGAEDAGALVNLLDALLDRPRELHVVLGIREDYLGRWRERVRGRRRLIENWVRLGPLTIGEITAAVCEAAGKGEPPQAWDEAEVRRIVAELWKQGDEGAAEPSDEDEIEAAHVQIVCRELFDRSAERGEPPLAEGFSAKSIFDDYLDRSLCSLREIAADPARGERLEALARALLEDHLVLPNRSRRLLTADEAQLHLTGCSAQEVEEILARLERTAILRARAQEHQSGRYFELGHDWLAKKLWERKEARAAEDKQRQETEARVQAERARQLAEVTGLLRVARAGELVDRDLAAWAPGLLVDVPDPEHTDGWVARAIEVLSLRKRFAKTTLSGHARGILAATWSRDGGRIVTGSWDGDAIVWAADGGGIWKVLKGHAQAVGAVAVSRDGRRVVTGSRDGRAALWDLDQDEPKPLFLEGHEDEVIAVAFSADDRLVATASRDCYTRVWDARGGALIGVLEGHDDEVLGVAFAPSGEPAVLTCSKDGTARIHDPRGPIRGVLEGHDGAVTCAAWLPGGRVVTGSADRTLRTWDAASQQEDLRLAGHQLGITAVDHKVLGDVELLLSASSDGTARVWRVRDGGLVRTLAGHAGPVIAACFEPHGSLALTASRDGTARLWDVWEEQPAAAVLKEHRGELVAACFDPSGERVLTASLDQTAKVWLTRGSGLPRVLGRHEGGAVSASTSEGGQRSATVSATGVAWAWGERGLWPSRWPALRRDVRRVLVSPDGLEIAQIGPRWVDVLQVKQSGGRLEHAFPDDVVAAAFGPRGLVVVTLPPPAAAAHVYHLDRDAFAWRGPIALDGGGVAITGACVDLQGERVALAREGSTTRVWDGEGVGPAEDRVWLVESQQLLLAVSADGQRLLAAGGPSCEDAYVLGAPSRLGPSTPLLLPLHGAEVTAGAFSADGARVITVASDKARVWSADGRGRPIVLAHDGPIHAASFSPDGGRVITASADGTARLWELSVASLRERLQAIARTDCMPPELRRIFLDEAPAEALANYLERRAESDHWLRRVRDGFL